MLTQCPHCNDARIIGDENLDNIVTCPKCGQEFVAEPMSKHAPPAAASRSSGASGGKNLMRCPDCGGNISRNAVACPHCGRRMSGGEDRLGGGAIILLWLLALIPFGFLLIVIITSLLYYVWRRDDPAKAKTINLHGWAIFLVFAALHVLIGALR